MQLCGLLNLTGTAIQTAMEQHLAILNFKTGTAMRKLNVPDVFLSIVGFLRCISPSMP